MGSGNRPPEVADGPSEPIVTDRVLTVPNLLSVVRLIGVPIFVYLLLGPHADGWALAILMLSGFTDWADGKLARLLNQTSKLGGLLDPLVDRLYVVSTLIAFAIRGIIPWWVAVILIGRDLVLALTLPIYRRRGLPPPTVLYLGKAATFALMFALPLVLAAQGDWAFAPYGRAWGYALLAWGTGLYVWTGLLYLLAARNVARTVPLAGSAGKHPPGERAPGAGSP
ncbi:CDP-alcohol phosphatidyltransferase family protein [Rhodococcus spelaei]|uniref:CDP-alcohol phosphatidyltransferase family protein n=1 Tax=Rhodococcus spelaei TaxID=2546320 RepID=A0A541B7C5_9NOCA|nr:CDP-alcohol phosphatidyltransferase family protein [Rhodococcus spelaei]TQF68221.1 CDP-alcohol phosphatidyltransferase family protein [Rhodococcus spelaei]